MKLQSREVKAIEPQKLFVNDGFINHTEEIEMKKLNAGLFALALMSVGFAATAANIGNGGNNHMQRPHMGNHHNMVYSVAEQTTTPNETVKKLANSAPKIEDGKRYVVKVTVMEVPDFSNMNNIPMPKPVNAPAAQ
ncbi:hypothetical protein [Providencia rettgeri]|jgi:hypothetical protein|uniref:hypothetical protein n=2 Tax=Morganellaceae TaxID=1903414 RepID=UPI00235FDECE|nr:hypothetical protein [Providencia rettgeri]MDR2226391.1 hypothetical protein [Providencia sp.]